LSSEREIRDQLLEATVLLLEQFEPANLVYSQPRRTSSSNGKSSCLTTAFRYVCSEIPIARHISVTGVPVSACRNAWAICSSVKRLIRIGIRPSSGAQYAGSLTLLLEEKFGRTSVSRF
jgi:hypothetical protein